MFIIKTHALLVNISPFHGSISFDKLEDYLYDYIDSVLEPYHAIGMFAYKEFPKDKKPIWGCLNPCDLMDSISEYSSVISKEYSNYLQTLDLTNGITFLNVQNPNILKMMQLFSGAYLYESCFYNCSTKLSRITKGEWICIKANVKDYVIMFANLYI